MSPLTHGLNYRSACDEDALKTNSTNEADLVRGRFFSEGDLSFSGYASLADV